VKAALGAAALLFLLSTLLCAATGPPAVAASDYSVFPQGEVGVAGPTIGWLVRRDFLLGEDERLKQARMWLDGREVDAAWDQVLGAVSYTPEGPLSPGTHHVRLVVEIHCSRPGYYYPPLETEFTFTVLPEALEVLPAADPEAHLALAVLNRLRTGAGLRPMTLEPALGAAAMRHAVYVAHHPEAAHTEMPGSSFFTAVHPWDRTAYFGYWQGGTAEVVAYEGPAELAVEGWLATLYHRIPLINPGSTLMGYGHAGEGALPEVEVIETGPGDYGAEPDPVRWPHPNQTGVPTGWPGLEGPDPFRLYPDVSGPVGYTITLTWTDAVDGIVLSRWSLTRADGEEVACMSFSPAEDEHLEATVALIPYDPLRPETTYTVSMSGIVDAEPGPVPFEERWSFTTGPRAVEVGPSITWQWSWSGADDPVTFQIDGLEVREGVRMYLDGLPVRDLALQTGGFSFSLPVGFQAGPWELLMLSPDGFEFALEGEPEDDGSSGRGLPSAGGTAFLETQTALPDGMGGLAAVPALVHAGGTVMVPAAVLTTAGADSFSVPEIGRTHWSLGGHTGCSTLGSAVAWLDGQMSLLDLPVQRLGGEPHVPLDFVKGFLTAAASFWDMAGHWARADVSRLAAEGIVSGAGDDSFRPEDGLTRAAFTKMLVRARKLPLKPGGAGGFTDTTRHWVCLQGYLGPALEAGIIRPEEYPGGRFGPDDHITREEIAVMVVRALGLDDEALTRVVDDAGGRAAVGGRIFTDAGEWGRPGHVVVAVEEGIVTGYLEADGTTCTFRPGRPASRAEAATMVVRMLDRPEG